MTHFTPLYPNQKRGEKKRLDKRGNGEKHDKRAAALNSLLVELTSKAKRRDEDGREYYIRDEIMPFDEDQFHEFKGRFCVLF